MLQSGKGRIQIFSENGSRGEEIAVNGKKREKTDAKSEIYDWIECIIVAIVAGIVIFTFLGRVVRVEGHSMLQTLQNHDMVLTSNLFYTPKSGDIVVLRTDTYSNTEPLIKRIIATEGQTIDIDFDAGVVYVDGSALKEDYTNTATTVREDFSGPVTVPEGCVFVMGDNRDASLDSRDNRVGMVDERCIIGRVLILLVPGADELAERDWSRIGSVFVR